MHSIFILARKEFRSYFDSPVAYVFIIAFLSFSSWLFFRGFFLLGQVQMRDYFFFLPWIFLIFIPAISMRLWAEEKKMGTIEILMTLPVKDSEMVLGKFFASLGFFLVTLALSFPIPLTLALLGGIDMGPIVGGYLGSCFLGAAYLSIGLFISSLAENQIVAFIIASLVSFVLFIIGEDIVLLSLPNALVAPFSYLGLGRHFASMQRGVLDSRDVLYYLTVIWFFLSLNTRLIASRRWS
ncbi:MAG TPA: ABC transporter permease subunit [Thermodesulfobacteriota bacterium]|nr:ABC transporter permease subunit [Thermodesulfobacteriota bacterium]